jgi:pSer/pThr/pTyr-binding forkhead associated (FHA) protein
MAKFVLRLGGQDLSEFELTKERVTIGRKPDNDLEIRSPAISGHHAVVFNVARQTFLEDLDSTNGTFVNGQRITKQMLRHGDVVTLGKHELLFVAAEENAALPTENPFDKTVVIRSVSLHKPSDAAHQADAIPPPPRESAAAKAKVAILNGPDKGKSFVFGKEVTTFGKKGVQVAAITRKAEGYYLFHVEGEGRPTVNEEPVGAQGVLLNETDIIEVAGIKMVFMLG